MATPESSKKRLWWLIAGLGLIAVVSATAWWLRQPAEPPISAPPPQGGLSVAPDTLGGAPLSTAGIDPSWIRREFPEYEQSSVVYEAYDARSLDQGAYFVVAFPGPHEEIPDLSIMSEDREDIGFVRCGSMVLHPEGREPVETPGHVCFRTSGDYSVSVATTSLDLEQTAALVDEFWALQ